MTTDLVEEDTSLAAEAIEGTVNADGTTRPRVVIDYVAHPRQEVAHTTYADELLYGGAAGGGKSRFVRMEALALALEVPHSATLILRRSFADHNPAGGMIPQYRMEIPKALGTYNAGDHIWTLRNGSTIELGYLARDADVINYQGAEYQLIILDEATQQTEFRFTYLKSRLRASGRIKDRMEELGYRPRIILTANPGGVGHAWVKGRFIDPAPAEKVWRPAPTLEDPNPGTRVFIPAKVTDNPSIDDGYINHLNGLDDDTRRMLRDGDWDVYQGQRFAAFRRDVHVIDPEDLPLPLGGIRRFMGVDYGLDAPFAALWGAVLPDDLIVIYRELYQAELTAEEQADMILASEAPGERDIARPITVALDKACWARSPHIKSTKSPGTVSIGTLDDPEEPPPGSIAAAYRDKLGASLVKANNDRLASVGLVASKLRVRKDGLPRILIYSTCTNLIRTLPTLPRDPKRPEDVDTHAEDHAYDALRYLLMLAATYTGPSTADAAPLAGSKTNRSTTPKATTTTAAIGRQHF
jgi:hypothetical protein